ncbi:LAO/AO transport system kinase [Oikeobacillus pervagus]|uniref:LAO/AO transport system kinase n=1 Tax=Oikeobacillus pervagus TaxID=1325931 RepID=A0AAJ1T205_9BACI|nr:methylmalonyl Co-A mutase-associated GTPase MeaB [Oikeobacillus pervagus]MDQ0213801.1 LAO/AO transport system kinase [Oikeobacillus pervagus]
MVDKKNQKTPESQSALHVMKGIHSSHDGFSAGSGKRFRKKTKKNVDLALLADEVLQGKRQQLARAITLIESNAFKDYQLGQELLQKLLPHTGNSIRIGITGVPGAGKSTFIESFGKLLCDLGYKVAVLAIDPSSSISGGSILGDKTRMELLSREENAFIRPSPSSGTLGGVHRKTRETMLLCEAAGFDIILIETVGVGQSEFIVRSMVDFFMLIVLTGAGDELQGMKKGIMELADAIVVNKADGDNKRLAIKTKAEYNQVLHFLQPSTPGWQSKAYTCSAIMHEGMDSLWDVIQKFMKNTKESNVFFSRRKQQTKEWLHTLILDQLKNSFYQHPYVLEHIQSIETETMEGKMTPSQAVHTLFSNVYGDQKR